MGPGLVRVWAWAGAWYCKGAINRSCALKNFRKYAENPCESRNGAGASAGELDWRGG